MNRKCLFSVLIMLMVLSVWGCRSVSERMCSKMLMSRNGKANWYADKKYRLNDSNLEKMSFAGAVVVEDVNVTYQAGLEQQAQCIAEQMVELNGYVGEITGIDITIGTQVYMLRVDEVPDVYNMSFKVDPNKFAIPLFVKAGEESCEAIIAANMPYPALYMHEVTEMSLIFRKPPGVIMPDAARKILIFKPKLLNYTRWLREGFANYASYLVYNKVRPQIEEIYPSAQWAMFSHPFSSLGKVGGKIFRWHQYSDDNLNDDYYNAALGLVLVMEKKFGRDCVRRIMERVYNEEYLDGRDLARVINEVLGVDIKKLADEFEFPELGFKKRMVSKSVALNEELGVEQGLYVTAVEPNGIWEAAGLKDKDVIVKVGQTPIKNGLDLELALFESLDSGTVDVTVWRKDGGESILKLVFH